MYNHEKQYRCTIIRGKSQKEMDDLLPAYAKVIDDICPCEQSEFEEKFNSAFEKFLPESERIKKTLDNHRTEISGKLFGMYYYSSDGMVYESERTQKYLSDNDQPAFFKDICFKMQFPNGMQKVATTVYQRVLDKINIRPYPFVLKLLQLAEIKRIPISKKALGYYVLNSLDVLQGKATPEEVLDVIKKDIHDGIERIISVEGKASSYTYQHINEQINYLELANLIRIDDNKQIVLNPFEKETIALFSGTYQQQPEFNVYNYDLENVEGRKKFQYDWDEYYSKLSTVASEFNTSLEALEYKIDHEYKRADEPGERRRTTNLTEFGDEGEILVYEYEKDRVAKFNNRLVNKVLWLGKTRGIGYDIQSVVAIPGDEAEFVKYIEVKSTKRLTCPDLSDSLWVDTLNVTRNEFVAARQHRGYYSIFRVFFTREGIKIFVLEDVADKMDNGIIKSVPITYRFEYSNSGVDEVIQLKGENDNV